MQTGAEKGTFNLPGMVAGKCKRSMENAGRLMEVASWAGKES